MSTKRKPFAVLDLETDPFKAGRLPQPFAAGFYNGDYPSHYWGDDCIKYLIEDLKEYDGYVYAHNGGKFDFHFMLDYLEPGTIKIINGRIAEMKIGKAILRDSFLILPVPLSAHSKTPIDYEKFEAHCREKHKSEILDYLRDDLRDLFSFVSAFFDRFPRRLTMPGIAIGELEKQCGKIERQSQNHDEKFRRFYYGGRVECFKSGKIEGDFKLVDINSAYPAAMRDFHPVGSEYKFTRKIPNDPIKRACSFYKINATSKGAAPARDKKGGIDFGDYSGEMMITGHELMAGLETDTLQIHQIHGIYEPQKVKNFAPFVDRFYAEKLEAEKAGDKTARLFAKLVMNSSYGKFASNPEKYQDFEIGEPGKANAFIKEGYSLDLTDFGGYWLWSRPIDTDTPQARYFDVATAASITGHVRALLWRSINAVVDPVYCDTDSILCRDTGSLVIGEELGQWSVETTVSVAYVAGKKLYTMKTPDGWKTASKGVKASHEQVKAAALGESVFVERETPTYSAKSAPTFNNRIIRNTAKNT